MDAQLARRVPVSRGDGSAAELRYTKGADLTEIAAAYLGADAALLIGPEDPRNAGKPPASQASLLAAYLAAQQRFDPMHNDLGALALYELAHAEADRALPDWYLYRLKDLGWERMPGNTGPSLFPGSWLLNIKAIHESRPPDAQSITFNFLGGRGNDAVTRLERGWVPRFARAHFSDTDFLKFTEILLEDWETSLYEVLGPFDHTLNVQGWNPKRVNGAEFCRGLMNSTDRGDWLAHLAALPSGRPLPAFAAAITNRLVYQERQYLDVLCNSRLTLAPAGDQPWSRRVYEAVACCSIPIVHRREHVGRTDDDLDVGYFVHLYDPAAPADAYAYDRAAATRNWHLLLNRSTFLDPAAHAAFMCPDRENEAPIAGGAKLPAVHARHILTHDGDAVEKVRAARQRLAEKARTRLRGEL